MRRVAAVLLFAAAAVALSNTPTGAQFDPPIKGKGDGKGVIDRSGATKKRLLKEFGGSPESEEAVMLGLMWLTQVQKPDGGWEFEAGAHQPERSAATGMAVLAFLGAGQSHKEGRYKQTVQAGLDWLVKDVATGQGPDAGKFKSMFSHYMYSQGIATLALCEAYAMTQDPKLRPAAQAAVDFIQRAQAANGSWGYMRGNPGDTSIVGWQIQALHAAKLGQLSVDDKVIRKAIKFLDFVSTGQTKSVYGYGGPGGGPATSLTAIGLLCRYYVDGWRADTAGFAEGNKGLMARAPALDRGRAGLDLYYFYYATQVVRYHGGDLWKEWNEGPVAGRDKDGAEVRKGGMADWLISMQSRRPEDRGSWDPTVDRNGLSFGPHCGRLGTTCMCLLTLEVYYRYDPKGNEKVK